MTSGADTDEERFARRIGDVLGACRVVEIPPGGDLGAVRGIVEVGARTVFATWAFSSGAVAGLRTHAAILRDLPALGPSVERVALTEDDAVLVTEHLAPGRWAGTADLPEIERLLEEIASAAPPAGLPVLDSGRDPWASVHSQGFGELAGWLEQWIPTLAMAAAPIDLAGDRLVHADLDLGHVWCGPGRILAVDWEFAAVGNPGLDRATVALDAVRLGLEPSGTGLEPAWPAYLAGVMASAIAAGPPPSAREPILEMHRRIELFDTALAWAAGELGLPAPPSRQAEA